MSPGVAVAINFAGAFVSGVVSGYDSAHGLPSSKAIDVALMAILAVTAYLWYRRDSQVQRFHGSLYFGGAVVLLAPLSVPYYLYRSRTPGTRGRTMLQYFGLLVLYFVVTAAGLFAYDLANAG